MGIRVRLWSLLAATAACGGSSAPTGSGNNPPLVQTIDMTDYAFGPASLTVKAGTAVKWVNKGGTSHTATSDDGTAFNSGALSAPGTARDPYGGTTPTPGGSFSTRLDTPGTYPYHCSFHGTPTSTPVTTMKGTITVTQ